ncbi:MAG TPA: hypothetical protein VML19_09390 [Verrucomicrobiae bacterium]|nr:hypothetical protein [Verrucomicrobiae bacterium]
MPQTRQGPLRACKTGNHEALLEWTKRWAGRVAERQGRSANEFRAAAGRVPRQWCKLRDLNGPTAACTLAGARFLLARLHGFAGWPKSASHLDALRNMPATIPS